MTFLRIIAAAAAAATLGSCAADLGFGCSSLAWGAGWSSAGRPDRAIRCLDGYIAKHAGSDPASRLAQAYARRGWAHQLSGDFELAQRDYREWLRLDPGAPDPHMALGNVLVESGQFDAAVAEFEAVRHDYPHAPWGDTGLALALAGKRQFAEALRHASEAIQVDSGPTALSVRGRVFLASGDYDRALADFTRAIELYPDRADVHYWRGSAKLEGRDYDGAIADFSKALELAPRWPQGLSARGAAYMRAGNDRAARADLDEAIALSPRRSAQALLNRAYLQFVAGEVRRARKDVEAAIEQRPRWWLARLAHARTLATLGFDEEARAALVRAEELATGDDAALTDLAWALATDQRPAMRDGTRAVTIATAVCERAQWQNATRLTVLAAALAEAGDFDGAQRRQQQAIELTASRAPDAPELTPQRARLALYLARQPYRQPDAERSISAPVGDPIATREG